jgi:hypothetical protein
MTDFIESHSVTMDHDRFLGAVKQLAELVEQCCEERQLQAAIERHPYILSEQFAHCHHVIPRVSLGGSFEVDFFCLDISSPGKEWIGVEIEPPGAQVVTKSGRRTALVEHALQQVRDWRKWIGDNFDYARKPRDQSGLGLERVHPRFLGWVVIGRRKNYNPTFNDLRAQIFIQIRSWDGILERARQRALLFSGRSNSPFYWENS